MIRLGIRVRARDAEPAYARLEPLLARGAEERDLGDEVEWALYGEPAALPAPARVAALAGPALLAVTREPVAPGWERAFHAHLTRVRAGGLAVRAPWVAGEPGDLVIDPGEAFGAGGHPTTRLCLELLQTLAPDGPLADWGTGTGVLAIAAARLGWEPVVGVERDPAAAALARENARENAVRVEVVEGDLATAAPWAPTVLANVPLEVQQAAAPERSPDGVIASGLLAGQVPTALAAWARHGLRERDRRAADGWVALLLERPGRLSA